MRARTQPVMRRIVVTGAILASIVAGGSYAVRMPRASINAPAAAPPPSVMVETLAPQKIRVWSEFSGRLHAVDSAEIRPEVGGIPLAVDAALSLDNRYELLGDANAVGWQRTGCREW